MPSFFISRSVRTSTLTPSTIAERLCHAERALAGLSTRTVTAAGGLLVRSPFSSFVGRYLSKEYERSASPSANSAAKSAPTESPSGRSRRTVAVEPRLSALMAQPPRRRQSCSESLADLPVPITIRRSSPTSIGARMSSTFMAAPEKPAASAARRTMASTPRARAEGLRFTPSSATMTTVPFGARPILAKVIFEVSVIRPAHATRRIRWAAAALRTVAACHLGRSGTGWQGCQVICHASPTQSFAGCAGYQTLHNSGSGRLPRQLRSHETNRELHF
jgi:hypothetical protein